MKNKVAAVLRNVHQAGHCIAKNTSALYAAIRKSNFYKTILHFRPRRDQTLFGIRIFVVAGVTIAIYACIVITGAILVYKGKSTSYSRFTEKIVPYPAAFVGKHTISLTRYQDELRARETYASVNGLNTDNGDIATFVMDQLINRTLYKDVLDRSNLTLNEEEVQNKLNEIRDQVKGDDKLQQFLHDNYGSDVSVATFTRWLREAGYESMIQTVILESVTVKHILVAVEPEATNEKKEAALKKILAIREKIQSPEQFGEIAHQYSEDIVSREKNGEFGTTNRGDEEPVISEDFEKTIFSLPVDTVSEPVFSRYGWHLVLVSSKKGNVQLSKKAFTEQLRQDAGVKILIPLK